jgi:hypothetical protein
VNSGVSSPGSGQLDGPLKKFAGRAANLARYSARVFLLLPPAVARAVILNRQFPERQSFFSLQCLKLAQPIRGMSMRAIGPELA